MKSPMEEWVDRKAEMEKFYANATRVLGGLTIGPSGKGGVYIARKVQEKAQQNISQITKDEARFIVASLISLYGLDL